jgi:hypothetical protein
VTTISGLAFTDCHLESMRIEERNSYFRVLDHFLLDFNGKSVIRSFGSDCSVFILPEIEVLHDNCFAYCRIDELIFESGSLLREISVWVFLECRSLSQLFIPASVRRIDGSAFVGSGITSIEVARDSSNFRIDGYFLLDSSGGLVRYFGSQSTVTISREIVALRLCCFSVCDRLRTLHFESGSALSELENFLFEDCTDLELIDLPPSLENVHGSAFCLTKITKTSVDPGNRHLRVIGDFLIDITRSRLIHYFGRSSGIIMSRSIEM